MNVLKVYDINITHRFKCYVNLQELKLLLIGWSGLVWEEIRIHPTRMENIFGAEYKGIYEGKPFEIRQLIEGDFDFFYNGQIKMGEELSDKEKKLVGRIFPVVLRIYGELNCPTLEPVKQ